MFKDGIEADDFKAKMAELITSAFYQARFKKLPVNVYNTIVDIMEKPLIEAVMKACRGNQVRAAEVLGINRNTLRNRLRKHTINSEQFYIDGSKRYWSTTGVNY